MKATDVLYERMLRRWKMEEGKTLGSLRYVRWCVYVSLGSIVLNVETKLNDKKGY